MTATTLAEKRIAIIGAGPGGLSCARILQRHGIPVTVYDRDPGPFVRNQGGSLDLHPDDGQRALREAGLLTEFFALARFAGQELRQFDPRTGRLLAKHLPAEQESTAPEIDRGQLRDLLLRSVEPGTVQWDHVLTDLSGPDEGPRTLTFRNGASIEADLIIGADGAWSIVRKAISSATPAHSGVHFLEAWFAKMTTAHPELAELVGAGSAAAADPDGALFAQRNSGDHMRVYIVRRRTPDWMEQAGLSPRDTSGIRAHLLEEYAGWSPALLKLITDNDGDYVDRPLYVLPAPHTWEPSASVTLLGDAAHLMPPAGVGVNLAMLDGCELALALSRADRVPDALRDYESTMFPRSTELSVQLDGKADFLLGEDVPEHLFAEHEQFD